MADVHPSVQAFIDDVKQILATDGESDAGLQKIADRMKKLTQDTALTSQVGEGGNVHAGKQSKPLYTDETGLTLVRARFEEDQMTPIHNHFCWGVVGVFGGRDRYQVWRRLDDGDGEGEARVEMKEELILNPGDAMIIPHPPQDIHAQAGYEGATDEFVLFGQNAMINPRLYFDTETNTAKIVQPRASLAQR